MNGVTGSAIQKIADDAMKHILSLSKSADRQEYGSDTQLALYKIKNNLWNTISGLWSLAAVLRLEERNRKETP